MTANHGQVVIISQHYPPDKSGNASRISDTCKHIAEEGWDVTVLAPPPAFPHGHFDRTWERKTTELDDGVTVHRLWAWQPKAEDPSFISRLAYYVLFPLHALIWLLFSNQRYDAIITSSPPIFTGLAGILSGFSRNRAWVLDVRDLWIDASIGLGFISEGGVLERLSRAYEGLVLRMADRVTVTTTVLGKRLTEQYNITSEKIVHLPNGVDTGIYQSTTDDPEPIIVYTGNVGHAQALESCVRAISKIDHPEATLKIVGDGDIRSDLQEIAIEENLQDRISFTGVVPRESIPEILDKAAVGVAPLEESETLEYAVPTKAYEYMSAELPVVATGTGEIEILMNESGGGILVEKDSDELANAFDLLLGDADKRELLGEAGRKHVVENYDREVVAKQLNDVLIEVTES